MIAFRRMLVEKLSKGRRDEDRSFVIADVVIKGSQKEQRSDRGAQQHGSDISGGA